MRAPTPAGVRYHRGATIASSGHSAACRGTGETMSEDVFKNIAMKNAKNIKAAKARWRSVHEGDGAVSAERLHQDRGQQDIII